jgi:hypothetical protein
MELAVAEVGPVSPIPQPDFLSLTQYLNVLVTDLYFKTLTAGLNGFV